MNMTLTGKRITLTTLTPADFFSALDVYNSNPAYNEATLGTPDRTMQDLQLEYETYAPIPSSHWLGIWTKERMIGLTHLLIENPHDQKSWIGLLLIHQDWQRQGYGREALALLENHVQEMNRDYLHTGILAQDTASLHFFGTNGYEQYRQIEGTYGQLIQPILMLVKPMNDSAFSLS
ncbi:GNAT family N-acetyltransferase [Brevibacillus migulae]|uniref:GNAT family N-acetyltransferase n=1 Tax=Brevibacillus migulae TaxID=1644114 RepID=UPI00106DF28B|nr:GNAT family N-acetyltransferase [Brevibacillus migulae]